jgi:hypothetical protein
VEESLTVGPVGLVGLDRVPMPEAQAQQDLLVLVVLVALQMYPLS